MDIQFLWRNHGAAHDDPLLSADEQQALIQQTEAIIRKDIARKLGTMTCEEHGEAPAFIITGTYDNESEQLDIQYRIDTCCQLFLVRVMRTLNQTN